MFRYVIPTLLLSIQLLLYIRTRNWIKQKFPNAKWQHWVVAGLFIAFNIALIYVLVVRPRPSEYSTWFRYFAAYPFFIWHGSTLFIGLILLISLLVKLPFKLLAKGLKFIKPVQKNIDALQARPAYQSFDASRRVFIRRSMYTLTAASFGASAYGMFIGKHRHEIVKVMFPIRNLPPQLHGFTITMLSDVHSSVNMRKPEMDEYVSAANALHSDMIVVTGDLVNSLVEEAYPFAEAFSELKAPHGVFGVLGNHDFFTREPDTVSRIVDDCGVKLLRNDRVLINKSGGQLYLLGIDDIGSAFRSDERIGISLKNASLDIPKVLMIHRPYYLQQAADRNIDLVLSGHTHGGQVVLASFGKMVIAPASLASQYVAGKYKIGNTHMYVNRGIGTVGLPIRLNCPPEITRITLVPYPPQL